MKIIDKETEIKIHGYEPLTEILVPDKKIIDFATFIEDLRIDQRKYYLGPSTKQEVLTNTKDFFNRHFKLHKVPYKGDLRCKIDKYILRYVPGIEIPLKIHNVSRHINPLRLPVRFSSSSIVECMVVENVTYISVDEFLNRMQLSFKEIILPPQINELTESSYVHELTHTELAHQRGIIKSYYNSEIPSIFMELLNIHESSKVDTLLPLQDAVRLTELYDILYRLESVHKKVSSEPYEDLVDATKYAESIIKAYHLFIEYYYGTPALKKYILTCIQNLLDGNIQLEDILDEFEITLNNSLENPNLIKYFSR